MKDLMDLMLRYAAEDPEIAFHLSELNVRAGRLMKLLSVKDGFLVEYEAYRERDSVTGLGAFVYRPNQLMPIFGQSRPLQLLIEHDAVELEDAPQALEWTKLYCGSIQGRSRNQNGELASYAFLPFQPDLPFKRNANTDELQNSLKILLAPPTVERVEDDWKINMITAFGSRLHASEFKVSKNCIIEMYEDTHVSGLASLHPQSWVDGLRVSLPFDESVFEESETQNREET